MTCVALMGYAAAATTRRPVPGVRGRTSQGVCLLRWIRNQEAVPGNIYGVLNQHLSRHRAITRVVVTAIALATVFAFSDQETLQAGPTPDQAPSRSILPANIGVGIPSNEAITLRFDAPMDRASVESTLVVVPNQEVALAWTADGSSLAVKAASRWRTDERYLVVVPGDALRGDGTALGEPVRHSFTTQTAPRVTDFEVAFSGMPSQRTNALLAAESDGHPLIEFEASEDGPTALPPTKAADGVSPNTSVIVRFSSEMDRTDVAEALTITPAVDGTAEWRGGNELVFTPTGRLEPGVRYTISLLGARDAVGNVLDGKSNFSFSTEDGAQVVAVSPGLGETDVADGAVEVWFSQPMDVAATEAGLGLYAVGSEEAISGTIEWNVGATYLAFTPDEPLAAGTRYEVWIAAGADHEGNPIDFSWSFVTVATSEPEPEPERADATVRSNTAASAATPAPAPAAVVVPPPAPSSDLNEYALNQINSARAAYGFAPVYLDAAASAAAYGHAYDQAVNNYFSHTSLDGRSRTDRLIAAGASFGYTGENQCYHAGIGAVATLEWCHGAFMAEPYPGHWNHIGNILDPRFTRVGVGIAEAGGRVVITWNFLD